MKKAFIHLHIAVLLAGLTGVLGRLISLNEGLLVWYRLALTAPSLWLLAFLRKPAGRARQRRGSRTAPRRKSGAAVRRERGPAGSGAGGPAGSGAGGTVRIDRRDMWRIFGIGGIAALHWVTFYGSIKYSNVSVGLVCFSAVGFFTAVLEPLIMRHRMDKVELLLGMVVIVGIFFIFQVDPHFKTGIAIGLLSALLGSLFPVLNKRMLKRVSSENVTLYEMSGGFLVLTLLMPFYLWLFPAPSLIPGWQDWIWLLVLAWACTVLAFNLSMSALAQISAFTVNLTYNLEPVYGILLAFALFREDKYLNGGFYIGFSLILLSIILQTVRLRRRHQLKLS
jgi:drug/metabolite transporter (DMT)-like permease